MNDVLLVNATEELQTLAEELERAGFHVSTCPADEVAHRLSSGDSADALVVNLLDEQAAFALRELLGALPSPPDAAVLAVVRHQQIAELDPQLAIDDFVVYPTTSEEIVARVRRAIWHRGGGESDQTLRCGDLAIDQESYRVFLGGRPVDLTYKEYELLRFLALNQDRVCTREMLLNRVWGYDFYGGSRTVDVHIRRLRSKIEDRAHTFIDTVRNVGYRFHAS